MKIEEVTRAIQKLNTQIIELMHQSKFDEYGEFCPDEYGTDNQKTITSEDGYTYRVADLTPDEWQLVGEYAVILEKLDTISCRLSYLNKPIKHEGQLYITSNDRYAVDGQELHCGYRCEYQLYDEEYQSYKWILDRVEYSDTYGGYYFFRSKKALEKGLTVRIRW